MTKMIYTLLAILVLSLSAEGQSVRKVPTGLINEIVSYNYVSGAKDIVRKCLKICYPDSLIAESNHPVLCPVVANLDGSTIPEVLVLVGWNEINTTLVVFKHHADGWKLIFIHPVHVFYNSPVLKVVDNASVNKVFCVRQLYDRGSGVFWDGYEYFKLINGRVINSFNMVNRAHIYGWGLFLNQKVQTKVSFSSSTKDMLWVRFNYSFFPGPMFKSDVSWDSHPEHPFVKGNTTVYYIWDSTTNKYVQEYPPDSVNNFSGLSDSQIECFDRLGDDSLFVSAFRKQIQDSLSNGSKEIKVLLKSYLRQVHAHSRAFTPSDIK